MYLVHYYDNYSVSPKLIRSFNCLEAAVNYFDDLVMDQKRLGFESYINSIGTNGTSKLDQGIFQYEKGGEWLTFTGVKKCKKFICKEDNNVTAEVLIILQKETSNSHKIYILFTTDQWKSNNSRVLRGIFTDETKHLLSSSKEDLLKNKVVDTENEISIITLYDGECETAGGYF
ncbi:hypothetical protein [Vallitalea guaymasensis]|uniref:hypothetical protein n=1 Tax=Vallitalea guaymasensis TaxID=1185412 RepID=UPI000DE51B72|nr:hypothetical protein [Vallitalea guaymasensis]